MVRGDCYTIYMKNNRENILEVHAVEEEFGAAEIFVESLLDGRIRSEHIIGQAKTVFDALFHSILLQEYDKNTVLQLSGKSMLGNVDLVVRFEGKRFDPTADDGMLGLEAKILEGYSDKIAYAYRSGCNSIRISVRKGPTQSLAFCVIGIVLAILTYIPIGLLVDEQGKQALLSDYIFPLEQLFANAMIMLGAPVTLFSLLKNTTDAYIVRDGNSRAKDLQIKAIATSVVAILLAFVMGALVSVLLGDSLVSHIAEEAAGVNWSFAEFVKPIVPSSIIAPFDDISPFPLIFVSLLAVYAMRSVGPQFDTLKLGIDVGYALFSRMLHGVMAVLPLACYLAFLDVMLQGGFMELWTVAEYILLSILCTGALFLTYIIRLRVSGVNVADFLKKLPPLIRENYRIGSSIDAVPFNIRYCVRNYGMTRSLLERSLPTLAQVNLDGNCFLIMLITMLYFFGPAVDLSPASILVVAILILFLSLGAPNQPGSILIGSLIIISYLGSFEMLPAAIYLEVFLGGIQNSINVVSAIVMAMEEDSKEAKLAG